MTPWHCPAPLSAAALLSAAVLFACTGFACSDDVETTTDAAGGGGSGPATSTGGSGTGGTLVCTDSDACDGACVDLMTDPNNCGACGRTCVVPGATASCDAGECALGVCDTGFANCDQDIDNGCEAPIDCVSGGACPTMCSSTGLLNCTDPCAPTCDLPAESCNLVDDDCDDVCDNGAIAGCRVGVHRASGNGHFYGTDQAEVTARGYNIEALDYFRLYSTAVGGLQPLFRCPNGGGKTFLTTATDCEIGQGPETTVGFISAVADACGAVPLYRAYNAGITNHFYTLSLPEHDNAVQNLGYVSQGIAGYVWTAP